MTVKAQNFEIYQGDDKQVIITVYDENGAILNLTGYAAVWVAVQQTTLDVVISKTTVGGAGISIPSPDNGQLVISLDAADTVNMTPKTYNHQCEIADAFGNHSTITTGYMTVVRNVTYFN